MIRSAPSSTIEGDCYATLVGDVAESRSYRNQKQLFTALRRHFEAINGQIPAAQPLRFSIGDEFQAAYSTLSDALRAIVLLRLRFRTEELGTYGIHDHSIRIGLAYGEIAVFDAADEPFGQSGPGWWQARSAIEEAERREKGHRLPSSTRSSFAAEDRELSSMTNALLLALDQVMFSMDNKDVQIALGMIEEKTQEEIGRELGIGQSTVSKRFKNNGAATVLMILTTLERSGS